MELVKGRMGVYGSIAYVPQQPWMQNQTVRQNITFGLQFDEYFYGRVMNACALYPDMHVLTHGDMTEIGEKVNFTFIINILGYKFIWWSKISYWISSSCLSKS